MVFTLLLTDCKTHDMSVCFPAEQCHFAAYGGYLNNKDMGAPFVFGSSRIVIMSHLFIQFLFDMDYSILSVYLEHVLVQYAKIKV